jgi:hypothetical protein
LQLYYNFFFCGQNKNSTTLTPKTTKKELFFFYLPHGDLFRHVAKLSHSDIIRAPQAAIAKYFIKKKSRQLVV